MAEQHQTATEALNELRELLTLAASEGCSQRLVAVRYTLCRQTLLHSELRPSLPGFLLQCLTFARFQDFIRLYHPRSDKRLAFIERELHAFTGRVRARPSFDVFEDLGEPKRASA